MYNKKVQIQSQTKFTIKSPAKINLFLYVTGRRDNGYHDLFTLMACVNLYDEIELQFLEPIKLHPSNLTLQLKTTAPEKPEITVACNNPDVPLDHSNLAFRAANLFNDRLSMIDGIFAQRVNVQINKRIPMGAGLGGGSSNAASVLKAMNQFYGSPLSVEQLMAMGLELGADVPFFILGGAAIAEGVGEKITPVPFQLEEHQILLFYPGLNASTAEVYKNIDLALTKPVKSNNKCLLKISGIDQGFVSIKGLMHNDLELSACALYPDIALFKKELADYLPKFGFLPEKLMMTGSGSTFFSIFSDYEKAQRCFNELSSKWRLTKKEIFMTSFINEHLESWGVVKR
ncbi:MAG: 4-(cytidine 5'-diphospho)-2-C-methyl-D-erythritol kinase [Desulfamplus sp.]|nr:4-(cytidine 5'-diphospho)-2-C-methyl-D-erythritol kinase [Desulfamplus sp.]